MAFLKRFLRVLVGQGVAFGPDLINWLAGTAIPHLGMPWAPIVGGLLNGVGKALRDMKGWKWVPV